MVVGIETDRGPWVTALRAAGYQVFAINPLSAARYRQRHSTSGAKSDAADAHLLAEIVRLDRDHHRPIAGDSDLADAVKLLARAHQTAIWERTRHVLRLRSTLREFFPAAVELFEDLAGADALALLERAPNPGRAAKLTRTQLTAALRAARRHHVETKADTLMAALRRPTLRQSSILEGAYAAIVVAEVKVIRALNEQVSALGTVVGEHFGQHPTAEIYLSQPGLGTVLAARTLGEFGDDTGRFSDARGRKTTPARVRSPAPQARRPSCSRASPPTDASASPCTCRPTPRSPARPGVLRHAPSTQHRSPCGPAPACEPARRHSPRLPQDWHELQPGHSLGPPPSRHRDRRCLTRLAMGCLSTWMRHRFRAFTERWPPSLLAG